MQVCHLASDKHSIELQLSAEGDGCRRGPEAGLDGGPGRVQAQPLRHPAHLQHLAASRCRTGGEEALQASDGDEMLQGGCLMSCSNNVSTAGSTTVGTKRPQKCQLYVLGLLLAYSAAH